MSEWVHPLRSSKQVHPVRGSPCASEAPPRTAKSMGTSNGPCGSLSASSRRDSRSAGRPPPSAAPNRATKAAVVVPPIVAGQAVVRLCGSGRRGLYPHPGTWLKCQYLSAQGALAREPVLAIDKRGARCSPYRDLAAHASSMGGWNDKASSVLP